MSLPLLLVPALIFLAIVTLTVGLQARARAGGLQARNRLDAYSPLDGAVAAPTPMPRATALSPLKQRRLSSIPTLDRVLQANSWGARTSLELSRAALPLRPGEYLLLRVVLAAVALPLAGSAGLPASLLAATVAFWLPGVFVRQRQRRRIRQFDGQLVEGLTLLTGALKSGYSFPQAMQSLVDEAPDPLSCEFSAALLEIRMGKSIEGALTGMVDRVRSADFELVVTAMIVQRQVGGNLTEILSNITDTVRERHRILGEVRTLTAQERLSGYVVAGLPVGLMIMLSVLSPGYISSMLAAGSGKVLLGTAALFEVLGLLLIRRIVAIEV